MTKSRNLYWPRRFAATKTRPLVAKTCVGCGYILDARHFTMTGGTKWRPDCSSCRNHKGRPSEERRAAQLLSCQKFRANQKQNPLGPGVRRYWTSTEIDFLTENPNLPLAICADVLGRSYASVYSKAFRLDAPRDGRPSPRGVWSVSVT